MTNKIGFIGAGNMASAILGGLIQHGFSGSDITICDHNQEKLNACKEKWLINTANNANELIPLVDTLIIAVKPQDVRAVLLEVREQIVANKTVLISIAAGITIQRIHTWLQNDNVPVIRVMPNMPALVGLGASAMYASQAVTSAQVDFAKQLMQSVGVCVLLEQESQMDIVTALSGSGPAFFFYFMEGLMNSAQALGLPQDVARTLCIQTALGSATLARQQPKLSTLREQVTSKGGTTASGLASFASSNFHDIIHQAIESATRRAEELNQQTNQD